MSVSPDNTRYQVINPRPEHFHEIQELCKRVYPFSKPWSMAQLESHRSYFPGGQIIAIDLETGKVVGLAFSLIILWNDYSPQDNWSDFTSGGFFHNHNPKKGKTLYGAEVMVDPEMRGRGIGKLLYEGRREICYKYGLKRIRAGARLRGYGKFQDKLTPHEYVVQVIEKKIFDPTLSFQLNQGFVVLDVAKNYLFNDPESLGYAAVIEWLNPGAVTAADIKKQKGRVEEFLTNQKFVPEFLPRELHRLVRKTTWILGEVMRESEGDDFFQKIENYRISLKALRGEVKEEKLELLMGELRKESSVKQFKIAHAFSLQLELVNVCEAAYRTWRQRQKTPAVGMKNRVTLKFVLTAHPTEARSPLVVEILQKITDLLTDGIVNNFVFSEQEVSSQIRLLWHHALSKRKSPTVADEAAHIFSLVFSERIFDFIVTTKSSYDLRLRTWVGGDKDGHPGVDAEVMLGCLTQSRTRILRILKRKLTIVLNDLNRLEGGVVFKVYKENALKDLIKDLENMAKISPGDGNRIKKWTMKFRKFARAERSLIRKHHQILLIKQMLEMFPALVMPIELREDASQICAALGDRRAAIRQMISELYKVSGALNLTYYARGLVISRCESDEDINNASKLAFLAGKTKSIPIMPLFESEASLLNVRKILKAWLQKKSHLEQVKRHWRGHFEVMLGYSDSAKEVGVAASRQLIQGAMLDVEATLRPYGIKPTFFHGSGGSVARGGGSLKEQISWWPDSAVEHPKITIQGEMIPRLFATKEILNSQCIHLCNEAARRRVHKERISVSPLLQHFSQFVEAEYRALIDDTDLLGRLLHATPYDYLELLKLGSRPSKRPSGGFSISSLRAIPWVLCWTQTRTLLPTWWGVGTAWKKMDNEERKKLIGEFAYNPFFSSFVKILGFTLAKVELGVWKQYFEPGTETEFFKRLSAEYKAAKDFVFTMSGEKKLIWYRPWLEECIRLRAPHIHILNLLQIQAMHRGDEALLKETVVGIASGMLTTG